jgi:biopolymer transport protein ExbB
MFMFLLSSAPASTASAGSGGFMDAFKENPYFIVANIVCSAIVVAVVVERAIFQFTKYSINSKEFFAQVKKLVAGGNVDRAIKLCEAGDMPTLQLVKAGLVNASKGADDIDAAMSEKIGELKPAVEKRVGMLWSLANIATLIGLLGTVFGLIHTFAKVADPSLSQADRQRALANGIAEAMYNTAIGLGIAVACMIFHLWLHGRAKNIAHDLEATQERVFNLLTIHARPNA